MPIAILGAGLCKCQFLPLPRHNKKLLLVLRLFSVLLPDYHVNLELIFSFRFRLSPVSFHEIHNMTDTKIFTLEGKGLKLDTAADVEKHIADLRANDVEEVRLLGNTLGVEACKVLGEVLATKKNLRVSTWRHRWILQS